MPSKGRMEPMGGGPDIEFFRRLLAPLKAGPTRAQAALDIAIATHNAAIEEAGKVAEAAMLGTVGGHFIAAEIRKLLRAP